MNDWLAAKNILAMRMDNMGDIVMLGPALRAVKETSPQARLTLLASPAGTQAAPLLPWIDSVITWRASWQDVGGKMGFDADRERALINLLAERDFDAALIFTSFSQTPHPAAYTCYLAGIPLRAGESKEFGGSTLSVELQGAPDAMHQVERNLRLVEHLGFVAHERKLVVSISNHDRGRAHTYLQNIGLSPERPYILIHPGASAKARRYPVQRFAAVANLLHAHDWQVLVTGVEREAQLLAEMSQSAPSAYYMLNQTTLGEYAALIDSAAMVICNDTLPMHLADALSTPAVVLFSGTDLEEQWKPRNTQAHILRRSTPCYPCYLFACPIGLPCLDIEPEEVAVAAQELLAIAGPHSSDVPESTNNYARNRSYERGGEYD